MNRKFTNGQCACPKAFRFLPNELIYEKSMQESDKEL